MNCFWFSVLLPPTTKLRQGNVFTPVCDSVHGEVSVQGSLSQGGLCPAPRGSLSRSRGVSVQVHGGLCPGPGGSLSRSRGVSVQVQGGLCPGVSIQGVSVQGGLCPGRSLSRGLYVQEVSVQGDLCPGESLSRGISVQGSLCQGDPPCGYMWVVRILRECILVDPATKNCKHNRGEKMGLDVVSWALMRISSVLMWILYHFSPFSKWYSVIVVKSDCPIGEECDVKIPAKFLIWFGVCPSSNYNLEENPFLKSPL